jgi:hypothetical protein
MKNIQRTEPLAPLLHNSGVPPRTVIAYEGLAGMASTMPSLTLPTASVPASPVGKAAVVSGSNYVVVEHQPDGTGVSTLLLERA